MTTTTPPRWRKPIWRHASAARPPPTAQAPSRAVGGTTSRSYAQTKSLQLYLNGQLVCPTGLANCAVAVDNTAPTGDLRLGRPGTDPISGSVESQHYGFIDDVAVFKAALTKNQIQSLINAPRLLGNEANLHAGWTFDARTPSGTVPPSTLTRPVVYQTITPGRPVVSSVPHTQLVSQARDNANETPASRRSRAYPRG